jgi:hypothetical protein
MKTQWKIDIPYEETERVALTHGDPADALVATNNYALNPLPDAIKNWHSIAPLLKIDHCYDVTAFYSRRKTDLSSENARLLYEYNQRAFNAATTKGGLLLYYQGVLINDHNAKASSDLSLRFVPNCLSFCIWESLSMAKTGAKIPEHKKASGMVALWYDGFAIVKYQIILKKTTRKKTLLFQNVSYTR